jgi:hypothetical protein
MNVFKKLFIKWYIKHGYTVGVDFSHIEKWGDPPRYIFNCPAWVKLLLPIFWSPSLYYAYAIPDFLKKRMNVE